MSNWKERRKAKGLKASCRWFPNPYRSPRVGLKKPIVLINQLYWCDQSIWRGAISRSIGLHWSDRTKNTSHLLEPPLWVQMFTLVSLSIIESLFGLLVRAVMISIPLSEKSTWGSPALWWLNRKGKSQLHQIPKSLSSILISNCRSPKAASHYSVIPYINRVPVDPIGETSKILKQL